MVNYNDAVNKLFSEKENLIIIGLTGRTGAGCSTASNILKRKYEELDLEYIRREGHTLKDQYKFDIIKEYISKEKRWVPFTRIEGSCVILSYIFEKEGLKDNYSKALIDYLIKLQSAENDIAFKIDNFGNLIDEIQGLGDIFRKVQEKPLDSVDVKWENYSNGNKVQIEDLNSYYELYINEMAKYKERIKKILLKYSCYEEKKRKVQDEPPVKFHLYTYLLQKIGNNIRASGEPYINVFSQEKVFSFAGRLEKLINLIIKHDSVNQKAKTRICIDAIRNANESNYLKDKYRPYYLISISVDEATRRNRLANLDIEEQNSLDNVEYNSKLDSGEFFYHQNIANCFEMADLHLINTDEKNGKMLFLTWQLVKYITLMIHPGLITPSAIERCMQLAYNVKYNSGCLSRQVGAVVTGKDYVVKSVGWNEVPQGHLSCSLRNVDGYCKGNMEECYSQFEYEDVNFQEVMNAINSSIDKVEMHGRKFSYCFKDIYNGYKNGNNQVYTRALHAEENAFLQISKYGGQSIKEGKLFCTASPCELCAKKAYQLGIEDIYYIDPYPGISEKHILNFGKNNLHPKMNLFYGAIGEAYIRLYKPLLPYKDELELVSGVSCKEEAKKIKEKVKEEPGTKDLFYHNIDFSIEFKNRENIESIRKVDIEIKNGNFSKFDRQLTWTGSSYDKSELINNDEGYTLVDSRDKVSPYKYQIILNREVKAHDRVRYQIKSDVKDETHLMHEYFAHMIKYPTEHLRLRIIIPANLQLLENVRYIRYADSNMEYEHEDRVLKVKREDLEDKIIYTLEVDWPNLFYTYSLEWDFIKVKS